MGRGRQEKSGNFRARKGELNIFPIESKIYTYEHLLDSEENLELIKNFTVDAKAGRGLEGFLKHIAAQEEQDDLNRTYLVKSKRHNELAGYFSLRNGLFTLEIENDKFHAVPAIELSNFAVNSAYRREHPESQKIGRSIFNDFILPLVNYLKDFTGVRALYIYALPEEKLIDHYKSMGFSRLTKEEEDFVHRHVKPKYDDDCIFMFLPL